MYEKLNMHNLTRQKYKVLGKIVKVKGSRGRDLCPEWPSSLRPLPGQAICVSARQPGGCGNGPGISSPFTTWNRGGAT